MTTADTRQYAPATQRNRGAILEVLLDVLPPQGMILEISSGTGEHAVFFAPRLHPRCWIPSDPNPLARASITAWRNHYIEEAAASTDVGSTTDLSAASLPNSSAINLYPPLALDVCDTVWPVEQEALPSELIGLDLEQEPIWAIANINMIHIAPWEACLGLMAGAGRILPAGGILYLYGPFKQVGQHTAPSNAAFDRSLQAQNPDWGVRDLDEVVATAQAQGFKLTKTVAMPANNLSVVFKKL